MPTAGSECRLSSHALLSGETVRGRPEAGLERLTHCNRDAC